jgi:quercetin dioxygenase-like cupin family protein
MAYAEIRPGARVSLERPLSGPHLSFDIGGEIARLRAERIFKVEGHDARTLVKYPDLRIVLTVAKPGVRMRTHETDERITLQCVSGRLRVHLPDGGHVNVGGGHLLALDKAMAHEVEALEESAFLLCLSWPGRG